MWVVVIPYISGNINKVVGLFETEELAQAWIDAGVDKDGCIINELSERADGEVVKLEKP